MVETIDFTTAGNYVHEDDTKTDIDGNGNVLLKGGNDFSQTSQSQKLEGNNQLASDQYGRSFAIDGDTAIVGNWRAKISGISRAGAAYIYVKNEGNWTLQQEIVASDLQQNCHFGTSVDIDGDSVVVGGYRCEGEYGAAYVFTRSEGVWTQQQKLTASDGEFNRSFGSSVAINGDEIAVGDPTYPLYGWSNVGQVYTFSRSGTTWSEDQILTAGDGSGRSGLTLAMDGDTLIFGGRETYGTGVQVYVNNGSSWVFEQEILGEDTASGDYFGASEFSIDISGDKIAVGSKNEDPSGISNAGSAYIFSRSGTTWTQDQKINASDLEVEDNFGNAVSLNGDVLVVGSDLEDSSGVSNGGSAYVFTFADSSWSETAKLVADDIEIDDNFGFSVAAGEGDFFIGSPNEDASGISDAGSVYVFSSAFAYSTTPYYLTTSDTSQKDTSTWTEINGVTLTQTTPTNTDLKYMVSFDGRSTWKYWDEDSWEETGTEGWDINKISYTGNNLDIKSIDYRPTGLAVNNDGTKVYLSGLKNDSVYQFDLSKPWDLSTAVNNSISIDISSYVDDVREVVFSPDGDKMYIINDSGIVNTIIQYSLSTPWDLSSAGYEKESSNFYNTTSGPSGLSFKSD